MVTPSQPDLPALADCKCVDAGASGHRVPCPLSPSQPDLGEALEGMKAAMRTDSRLPARPCRPGGRRMTLRAGSDLSSGSDSAVVARVAPVLPRAALTPRQRQVVAAVALAAIVWRLLFR